METGSKERLQEAIHKIQEFINSTAHVLFVKGTQRELSGIEQSILDIDPLAPNALNEIIYLQGQRRVLLANVTSFEDTVDNLENRIQAILDEENPIPHNDNQEI